MPDNIKNDEALLKDNLINTIILISAFLAIIALTAAQLRAYSIGWTFRDAIQILVSLGIFSLALFRKKFATQVKALLIVFLYTVAGISGVFTLGILGGLIFLFPAASVILSVFYSKSITRTYYILTILFLIWVAFRFSSGQSVMTVSADSLMRNPLHWVVYIACITFFFVVACQTVHIYRQTMQTLLEKIKLQRDELTQTNQELINTHQKNKVLQGLLPICAACKKIRDDKGYWNQLETYIKNHSEAEFTHGICPDCLRELYPDEFGPDDNEPSQ